MRTAERYDLVSELDIQIIEQTLLWMQQYHDAMPCCSINLSGKTIGNEVTLSRVMSLIEQYNIPGQMLCFEITETAVISNLEAARHFISGLRAIGCRFTLDDFGSGLSSFSYLRNLQIDYLKIDGAFIRDVADDPLDRQLVEAIHSIGHILGLETIAENVENEDIRQTIAAIGTDFIQGFAIHKPAPLEEINPQTMVSMPAI